MAADGIVPVFDDVVTNVQEPLYRDVIPAGPDVSDDRAERLERYQIWRTWQMSESWTPLPAGPRSQQVVSARPGRRCSVVLALYLARELLG